MAGNQCWSARRKERPDASRTGELGYSCAYTFPLASLRLVSGNNSLVLIFVGGLVIQAGCRAALSTRRCERHEVVCSAVHAEPHRVLPNCLSRQSMYRFHCGGEAGETARSGRLKPWTSLGAADRLIFVPGFLVAACFIATSPVTESLQSPCVNNSKGQQSLCLIAGAVDLAWP